MALFAIFVRFSLLTSLLYVSTEAYIPFGSDLVIDTFYGRLKGFIADDSYAFWGIPFARPPVGDLRLADPRRPLAWTGTKEANRHAPGCMQECHEPPVACPLTIDEDCLYLDIWIPRSNRSDPYPVFIFMHGGNFRDGSGTALVYDGRFLAHESDAIVVTINYRMEAFGWLFLGNMIDPATGKEMSLVNQGLKDQQMAFLFVKENIHFFGGDPNRARVADNLSGQSAGAQSVGVHLLMDSSENLFEQAIQFSNPFTLAFKTKEDGVGLAAEVALLLGCDTYDLVCWRSKDAKENCLSASRAATSKIINRQELLQIFEPWSPGVGAETELPEGNHPSLPEWQAQRKPTMLGTTREEGRLFIWLLFKNRSSKHFISVVFSGALARLLPRYHPVVSG
ncbi:putative crystal protein-like [Apostichopus japonicus]|uniref:Putative crystal protein-like n=1 Tax=Stichopus japonicus TaxID=307972 RepID=A0A2G8JH92_STIJA|nr:putative crystal protein-like [Apostichopus japonicus]